MDSRFVTLFLFVAIVLTGCGGGTTGNNGVNSLVKFVNVEAGADCVTGGIRVNTGADANANNELEEAEITSTSLICNGTSGLKSLVSTSALPAGDTNCPAGGTAMNLGIDTNDNGTLDESEITATQNVCAGDQSLLASTSLAVHDANCPAGGTRVDHGIDANGNGTLDSGEVEHSKYVCQGEDALTPKSMEPPVSPAAQYTINTSGGDGAGAAGGQGGPMDVSFPIGSDTGHIKFFKTGQADASFNLPSNMTPYLGINEFNVAADKTVKRYAVGDHTGAEIGEVHTHDANNFVQEWNGVSDERVTGVSVASGVTLTLELNFSNSADLNVQNGFINKGTITTAFKMDGISHGDLRVYCDTFYGATGSLIDVSGVNANPVGGNGGLVNIVTSSEINAASTNNVGAFYNQGEIRTRGGDGAVDGGTGGSVMIMSTLSSFNTGNISTVGGKGTAGNGGNANVIEIRARFGNINNSGKLTAAGGEGAIHGGFGGTINLRNEMLGDVKNSGELTTNGGVGGSGNGGSSNIVQMISAGGGITNSGDISARGGDSMQMQGGNGSPLEIRTFGSQGWHIGNAIPAGDILISGNIDLSGGDGNTAGTGSGGGGVGGVLHVTGDLGGIALPLRKVNVGGAPQALLAPAPAVSQPYGQEIIFLGYSEFNLSGGSGTGGGSAGFLRAYQTASINPQGIRGSSGGVVNYVNVIANGGDASDGMGGEGGAVALETDWQFPYLGNNAMLAKNFGDVQLHGGDGTVEGGSSGGFVVWGYYGAENHGSVTSNGGDATFPPSNGGHAGVRIECLAYCKPGVRIVSAYGPAINTGNITAIGGNAIAVAGQFEHGGNGALVEIVGYSAENTGDINVAGGNASTDNADDAGGDGGSVMINGIYAGTSNTSTSINILGGTGKVSGQQGVVHINALDVTGDFLP